MNAHGQGRRQFLRRFAGWTGLAALGAVVAPPALGALALAQAAKHLGVLAPVKGLKVPGWRCINCLFCNDPNAVVCEFCSNDYAPGLPPCDYPECGCQSKTAVGPVAAGSR